jgi:DNA-directed RNA polymerase specialized sigma subunit
MINQMNETELQKQYISLKDVNVREEMVLRYVSLVHFVLGRLGISQGSGNDYDDLVNQGLIRID